MSPKSVFDLVKSHMHRPINRNYAALKQVLRDWHQYCTQVPLQEKPTFPAELLITITRTPPSTHRDNAGKKSNKRNDVLAAKFLKTENVSSTGRSRRWSLWKSRTTRPSIAMAQQNDMEDSSGEGKPFVYHKVIPLHVWTSVLPWEMQRGLSFSDLALPSALKEESDSSASAVDENQKPILKKVGKRRSAATNTSETSRQAQQKTQAEDEEEEDPYGIVTPAAPATPVSTLTSVFTASAAHRPFTSVMPPTPAMLFLSDLPSTRTYGIGFWSGAIQQPIDVLFVGPTLPASVGLASASFQQLREEDGNAAVEENHVSRQVLTRYFPLREMQPTSSASASAVTFRVHSFGHLDPLPPSLHPCRLYSVPGREPGKCFTATPDVPYNSIEEAPRYVFETPRHTLQFAVGAALEESRSLLQAQTGAAGKVRNTTSAQAEIGDQDVSIDLVVNFSDALRKDVFAKAQLCVEYVSLLEEAIAYYAQQLNTDRTATAVAADPLGGGESDVLNGGAGANERLIKVWLSEHESRWMTPQELRKASQSSATAEREFKEKVAYPDTFACADDSHHKDEEKSAAAYPVAASTSSSSLALSNAALAAAAAAQAVGATPVEPDAVSAARSISLQSPMLRDETEGRPSYLAPSFVGRHEASTLQNSAIVLSADKLARYPKTHSHMPQLPPIDYELYDLCMRLGVGQRVILYHYHERIMKEWRAELQRRRSLGKQSNSRSNEGQRNVSSSAAIDSTDVERMVALVRDRSLQLPPELVSLVEAVAAA